MKLKYQSLFNSYVVLFQIDPKKMDKAEENLSKNHTEQTRIEIVEVIKAAKLEVALNPEEAARKRLAVQKHKEEVIDRYRVKKPSQRRIEWLARDPIGGAGWVDLFVEEGWIEDARRIQIQLEKNRLEQSK